MSPVGDSGKPCARRLAAACVHLFINGRKEQALESTRAELARDGIDVLVVRADVTTREGQDALQTACPEPDILINN